MSKPDPTHYKCPNCRETTDMSEVEDDGYGSPLCPNCRLFFDTGGESDDVFCGEACRRRHERGEYL